jgi:kynurenine formamidase
MQRRRRIIPTTEEIVRLAIDRSNWGRWGQDDQRGTINLITPEKVAEAALLVKSGRRVSLSHPLGPDRPAPRPPVHIVWGGGDEIEGGAADWFGTYVHGQAHTHVDALNHFMGPRGAWNGKRPEELFLEGIVVSPGALWGAIDQWSDGVVTRGVLLDVPRYRGEPFVSVDSPVHGWELEAIAAAQRVQLRPGDALIVYCGRERYEAVNPRYGPAPRPGLHGSCVEYFRDVDCAVLVWDMHDYGRTGSLQRRSELAVHYVAIPELGLAIVDNALLDPLRDASEAEGRYEFLLAIAPLRIVDGTGSPVNPLAIY